MMLDAKPIVEAELVAELQLAPELLEALGRRHSGFAPHMSEMREFHDAPRDDDRMSGAAEEQARVKCEMKQLGEKQPHKKRHGAAAERTDPDRAMAAKAHEGEDEERHRGENADRDEQRGKA